jgi:hypothetical protein
MNTTNEVSSIIKQFTTPIDNSNKLNNNANNKTKNFNKIIGKLTKKKNNNISGNGSGNVSGTELVSRNELITDVKDLTKKLKISNEDFTNLSPDTINEILQMLINYVNIDKSFRMKHEALKTLYKAFLDINKKYQDENSSSNPKHEEALKNIHTEMKENNTGLFRHRLIILKKIKDNPQIETYAKDKICSGLLAIFKSPPNSNYQQFPMLEPVDEKISVKELDNAYLQKHNELMTVYKAYENLFSKVVEYKDQLNKYKELPTGSTISRKQMDKLINDQAFVMKMIDKMQDKLVSKNIISNSEKVPVNGITNNPDNMGMFNDTMREQIKQIIDRRVEVNNETKTNIQNLLEKFKDCDSNDKFCTAGRKLILLKKLS